MSVGVGQCLRKPTLVANLAAPSRRAVERRRVDHDDRDLMEGFLRTLPECDVPEVNLGVSEKLTEDLLNPLTPAIAAERSVPQLPRFFHQVHDGVAKLLAGLTGVREREFPFNDPELRPWLSTSSSPLT